MLLKSKALAYRFLRWSERYTKTDMLYLARGGGWLSSTTAIASLLSLLSAVAFANLLSKETYGTYQYVLSMAALLGLLTLPGINTAIGYAVARGADGSFLLGLRSRIRWGTLASMGALGIAAYYLWNANVLLGGAFLITSLFLPFWESVGTYVSYLHGKKEFRAMSLYELGAQAVSIFSVIITLLLTNSVWLILLAYFASWTLSRLFFLHKTMRTFPANKEVEQVTISYGMHITAMKATGAIASNIDKFLLWHLLGPAYVATYIFSITVPLNLASSLRIVNRLAFPKMAMQTENVLQTTLLRKIIFFAGGALLIALLYIAAAPYLFAFFFPQYMEAVSLTQSAAFLVALQPFSLIATSFTAHANIKNMYIHNIGTPVVRICLMIICIPLLGIMGAIVALLVSKFLESILLLTLFLTKNSGTQE